VRDVCTYGINNLRYIHPDAPVHVAMEKMIAGDVRHLFILSSSKLEEVTWPNVFSGLISIRDIIKFSKDQDKAVVTRLEDAVSIKNVKATEREY
jgi:CBS domain-containing protein